MNPPLVKRPFGFNLIGHVSTNLGLAVVARSVADLIRSNGFPLAAYDMPAGLGRVKKDSTLDEFLVDGLDALPYAINLFVLGGSSMRVVLEEESRVLLNNGFFNAAAAFWELPTLPPRWLPAYDQLDVIVAMSEFIRYAHEFAVSGPSVISGRMPHEIPAGVATARARYGLPDEATVFVTAFEPHSDPERKNTRAAIDAFMHSLSGTENAFLFIKINNPSMSDGSEHPVVAALRTQFADHPRVRLFTEALTYPEVLSLYESCDVYVSLHRAEGLGLGMAEAMALGKAVIATGWSGNLTFMNHLNACLVGYRLVPIQDTSLAYRESQLEESTLWAEPDVTEAAAWMRYLFDHPDARKQIGNAAKESMRVYNEEARKGRFLSELQSMFETRQRLVRTQDAPPRDTRARMLKISRLARIQELERELNWIKASPTYRIAEQVKRLVRPSPAKPKQSS